jgi:hypothetical protein
MVDAGVDPATEQFGPVLRGIAGLALRRKIRCPGV